MVRLLKEIYCMVFRGGHTPTLMEVYGNANYDVLRCIKCKVIVQEVTYARTRRR